MAKRAVKQSRSATIHAGETLRFMCCACSAEFEIRHEPLYADVRGDAAGPKAATIEHCPYCGEIDCLDAS